jgi:hypothetical protein
VADIDPAEAARIAEGADDATADAAQAATDAADMSDDSGGPFGALTDALTQTEPSRPLETIESPWNPEQGGVNRIQRGIQKMTNTDGIPAWVDIVIGAIEVFVDNQTETQDATDPEGIVPVEQ